ncbi:MAG: MarR family winged helix-turn-helix transcriptional regulator [Acidimicrobiales bacterium]|nr:MarR family winged helix-turn-helix transcriptional regulator [Acidimicrobiales bacterium]
MSDQTLDRRVLAAVERLGRALRAARQRSATHHGLSLLGLSTIEILSDGRPRRIGALAAELHVSQPTVSDAVTALHRRGLLVRERDPVDLRSTLVTLSGRGAAVATAVEGELRPLLAVESGTTVERAVTLRILLAEISRLQRAGVITINRSCLGCRHYDATDATDPAWCLLLETTLRDEDLRVDCPEYEPAAP